MKLLKDSADYPFFHVLFIILYIEILLMAMKKACVEITMCIFFTILIIKE